MGTSVSGKIKEDYEKELNKIIVSDPVIGPLFLEREELRKQITPSLSRISDLNNIINNTASGETKNALKSLRVLK